MTLRCCLVCQTFLFRHEPLCEYCWSRFQSRAQSDGPAFRTMPIFVQSLFGWDNYNDDICRPLIYGMKNVADSRLWKRFALLFRTLTFSVTNNSCLVPIPSKRNRPDHAYGLALAMHDITGLPLEPCLVAIQKEHQRTKSKLERGKIQIVKSGRLGKAYSSYILIDDVVTSGATLDAAYKALKKPKSVQAWCFMDRRLVAEGL